jgi:hypothetical protein
MVRCALFLAVSVTSCNLAYPLGDYEGLERDAVRLLQQGTAQGSATRALTVTLPRAPTNGSALVLVTVSVNDGPTSVSGGAVGWVQQSRSSQHVVLTIWVGFVPPGATSPITVTWAPAPADAQLTAIVHCSEWSGLRAFGPKLPSAGNGGTITTAQLAVKEGAGLIVAAAAAHKEGTGPPANGFVPLDAIVRDDTQLVAAYRVMPPAATYSTSWTYPSPDGWDATILALGR